MPGSSAESTDTIVEEGRSRSLDRKDTKKKKRKRYVFFLGYLTSNLKKKNKSLGEIIKVGNILKIIYHIIKVDHHINGKNKIKVKLI